MKCKLARGAWVLMLGLPALAAVPPPEQLLPADAVAVLTLPSVARARAAAATNATGQFWADPAMKTFHDQVVEALRVELIAPLEREFGVRLADYTALLNGQLTLAWVAPANATNASPGWLLLADTGDKANDLGLQLTGLRKKWAVGDRALRIDRLQEAEFTSVVLSNANLLSVLARAFAAKEEGTNRPAAEAGAAGAAMGLTFGQSGPLLVVASDTNVVQGVLTRLTGAAGPALRDNVSFRKEYQARFKDALAYAWVDLKPLTDGLVGWANAADAASGDPEPDRPMPRRSALLAITGLTALKSISLAWTENAAGSLASLNLGVPGPGRTGLFKLIEFESKDSGPPFFVPAEAVQFQRWRLSLPRAWTTLEQMFTNAFPAANTVLKFLFQTAGKENDPNYDLRAELLGALGDDILTYELAPRTNTPADPGSPASLTLLGSTNADRLATALKSAAALLPPPLANVTQGELQGRKLYSLALPSFTGTNSPGGAEQRLAFAAATNVVAFSTDTNLLAAVLAGTNTPTRPLRELPGLGEAAQQIGGLGTGLFGYEDSAARMRRDFDALKLHPTSALTLVPPAYLLVITGLRLEEPLQRILARCDFALLPPFDPVARYFHFTVYAASVDAEGYSYRVFSPVPPALTKPAEPTPAQSPSK